jgi:hypothetical protein
MTEQRAGDVEPHVYIREIGGPGEAFHKVILTSDTGDHVTVHTTNGTYEFDRDEVVEVAHRYLVSFGSVYRYEPHPVLGYWPELGQDAVLEVFADSDLDARKATIDLIGSAWCAVYGPTNPPGWEALNLGTLEAAVEDPKPKSWTVGCQVTLNADGSLELHLEDVEGDLTEAGAPRALVAGFGERTQFYDPDIQWVKR